MGAGAVVVAAAGVVVEQEAAVQGSRLPWEQMNTPR
jgi:predicted ATPase